MGKLKKNWPVVLLLLAIAGCMFILNISTLISPDDYSYAYYENWSYAECWIRKNYFVIQFQNL